MKVPYIELELTIATIGLEDLIGDDEKLADDMDKATLELVKEPTPQNIANHFGITTLELANSPNRQQMSDEFMEIGVRCVINYLKTDKGFTDKQAWALVYASIND